MSEENPSEPTEPTALTGGASPDGAYARALEFARLTAAAGAWEPPSAEEAAALFPGYELLQIIGRGGMGAVYQARQVSLDRLVAIKLMPLEISQHGEFADGFRREARIMARLHHPNIIAVHDFGQTGEGHLFIVMEYVEGWNLHEIIHETGLDGDQALSLIGQVCTALSYAHGQGVVHRDIKPGNVMIDSIGQVKVADFGLARLTEPGADRMGCAVTQIAMGTPDYVAPEQTDGQPVDHRADIYALGVVLYEMLCRQVPKGAFQPPSARVGCDARIDAIVIRAMQQQPARRYQNAAEMNVDVERARVPVAGRKPVVGRKPVAGRRPMTGGRPATGSRPMAGGRAVPGPRRVTVPAAAPKGQPVGLWIGLGVAAVVVVVFLAVKPKAAPPPKRVVQAEVPRVPPRPVATPPPKLAVVEEPPRPAPPPPEPQTPATPAPKQQSATAKWLAEQEPPWQEAFKREVTAPFEKGRGDLQSQYLATLKALLDSSTRGGQLDAAVVLRDEQQRFSKDGVPATDKPNTLASIVALRSSYRKSLAVLEAARESKAKAVAGRIDAILASNLLLLTRSQRLDEALELKTKREQLAAEWLKPSASTLALAASGPRGTPAATPDRWLRWWQRHRR